jgi:hypothetical protein
MLKPADGSPPLVPATSMAPEAPPAPKAAPAPRPLKPMDGLKAWSVALGAFLGG